MGFLLNIDIFFKKKISNYENFFFFFFYLNY